MFHSLNFYLYRVALGSTRHREMYGYNNVRSDDNDPLCRDALKHVQFLSLADHKVPLGLLRIFRSCGYQ
jgi:hypothetical protein